MDASLVQDDVEHLGKPILHILHVAGADDFLPIGLVRFPEDSLIDPLGFAHQPLHKTEVQEHLHGATGGPTRLKKCRDRI